MTASVAGKLGISRTDNLTVLPEILYEVISPIVCPNRFAKVIVIPLAPTASGPAVILYPAAALSSHAPPSVLNS